MEPIPARALHLALAAFLAAALLHLGRVPLWCAAAVLLALGWRLLHLRGWWPLPGTWLRALIALALTAATLASYRTLNGLAAGSALLLAMGAAKTLEVRQRRDAQVLVITGLLLVLAACLDRQALWRLPFDVAGIWLCCAALAALGSSPNTSLRTSFVRAGAALAWALPLAIILFVFVPRLPGALWSLPPSEQAQTGLSEQMSPGSISELAVSDDPAFRVRFASAPPPPQQRYWRGPVLHHFDGYTWSRGTFGGVRQELQWLDEPVRYSVMLEPSQRNWLFGLDTVASVSQRRAMISWDGQIFSSRAITSPIMYEAVSHLRTRTSGALPVTTRRLDTQLPAGRNPRSRELAQKLRAEAPDEQAFIGSALALFRDGGFEYSLTPPLLDYDSVDDLLFNTRLGFCGHFASAFAFMMRAAGLPARVVTGYLGGEWNAMGGYFIVRQSHAHAWVEVWVEDDGWVHVDPTAVVAPGRLQNGLDELLPDTRNPVQRFARGSPLLRGLLAAWDASNLWWQEQVVNFNQAAQRSLLEKLGLKDVDWQGLAWLLLGGSALWVGFAALWYRRGTRAARPDPAAQAWLEFRKLLEQRGLCIADHEPHLAMSRRAMSAWPDAAPAIERFVQHYVQLRFGAPRADSAGGNTAALKPLLRNVRRAIGRQRALDDFADLAGLPLYERMPQPLRLKVAMLATTFMRRVHFEGCGGLVLTAHMRRTIAFQACVPIVQRGASLYSGLRAVLVYPDVFVVPQETEDEAGVITRGSDVLSGQTEDESRVLLSWKDVEQTFDAGSDYNVVLHEFAHVIDHALDGQLSRRDGQRDTDWHDVLEAEYQALCTEVDAGAPTLIDPYGTEDPAEFLAVCTETFFGAAADLAARHPRLYAALSRLYGLDPASWPG